MPNTRCTLARPFALTVRPVRSASETEPPVGAVTAFLGGPFFLWLFRRTAREATSA